MSRLLKAIKLIFMDITKMRKVGKGRKVEKGGWGLG